jgi:formyltetrahydrofolate deformylase
LVEETLKNAIIALLMKRAILLISCPDQKGITAAVTGFIADHNGNILHADQHIDDQTNTFFMRVEWNLEGFKFQGEDIQVSFSAVAARFIMNWELNFSDRRPRAVLYVSRKLHCLQDLLIRHKAGQFECDIPLIISNHPDAQALANEFKIRFVEFYVTKENKNDIERQQLELIKQHNIDVVILAQYHQILSGNFVRQFPNQIINIHHSFLPAFVGENPYRQAYQKGVKIIGATSHYVIEDLDAGPIIEQDTVRVSHRDALEDLVRKGEDLEKVVLSRAVRWHLQKKILCYGNKTVVFD